MFLLIAFLIVNQSLAGLELMIPLFLPIPLKCWISGVHGHTSMCQLKKRLEGGRGQHGSCPDGLKNTWPLVTKWM